MHTHIDRLGTQGLHFNGMKLNCLLVGFEVLHLEKTDPSREMRALMFSTVGFVGGFCTHMCFWSLHVSGILAGNFNQEASVIDT